MCQLERGRYQKCSVDKLIRTVRRKTPNSDYTDDVIEKGFYIDQCQGEFFSISVELLLKMERTSSY